MNTPLNDDQTTIDALIKSILNELDEYSATDPEYKAMMKHLNDLRRMQEADRPQQYDKNTILTCAASLIGIAIIVGYEQKSVITSKAIGFIPKLK